MQTAIQGFFNLVWGAPISVTLTMYNASGNVTTNVLQSVKNVYNITVLKSLPQASTNYVNFQKVSTKSTLQFLLPRSVQLSSPPIAGGFTLTCNLPDGSANTTTTLGVQNSTTQIYNAINIACPNYKEKYELWDGPAYAYYQDGRDLFFRFIGLNYDVPQMTIQSSNLVPLVGNTVQTNSTTPRPYDPTLILYEPLPFEFVRTNETQAQVLVSVDGLPAVCACNYCGYNYTQASAQITGYSLNAAQNSLTIDGANFLP